MIKIQNNILNIRIWDLYFISHFEIRASDLKINIDFN